MEMEWPHLTERLRATFERAADVAKAQYPELRASLYFDSFPPNTRYHGGLYFFRRRDEDEILSCELDVTRSPHARHEGPSSAANLFVDTINFYMASSGTATRRPQLIEVGETRLPSGMDEREYETEVLRYADRISAFIDANMDFVLHNVGPDQ